MARSVFLDTQIPTRVVDGKIPIDRWSDLLRVINGKYEYRVSLNTFLELLNALAGGNEANFERNRKRLLVLTEIPKYEFLPLPGQFIRHVLLGLPLERPEFSPRTLQEQWMPVIKAARSKKELTDGVPMGTYAPGIELTMGIDLKMIQRQMQEGQKLWIQELQLAKKGNKDMPPKRLYAEFHLHFFAGAATTPENVSRLSDALDAAYHHLASIHHQSTKSTYKFEQKHQDWIDNQQLMYLVDPECTFVTGDQKLIAKLGRSIQSTRVRDFDDFVSSG